MAPDWAAIAFSLLYYLAVSEASFQTRVIRSRNAPSRAQKNIESAPRRATNRCGHSRVYSANPHSDANLDIMAGGKTRRTWISSIGLILPMISVKARGDTLDQTKKDSSFEAKSRATVEAFEIGDYETVRSLCMDLLKENPNLGYAWSLLGTTELILGSKDLTMTRNLTDKERGLIEDSVKHFDIATSLIGEDAITYNNKGNALGLLGDWKKALMTYEEALEISLNNRMKDFEVIPMMNKALALYELERDQDAENELILITRRHADYEDAYAALAAVRFGQGKSFDAADAFDRLCELDYGVCDSYSDIRIVLGRWPKRAIRTYRDFLEKYLAERRQPELR